MKSPILDRILFTMVGLVDVWTSWSDLRMVFPFSLRIPFVNRTFLYFTWKEQLSVKLLHLVYQKVDHPFS